MDDKKYTSILQEYNSFKERIEKEIKGQKISSHYNECFFINDTWIKKLNEKFIEYENNKKSKNQNN